MISIDLDPIEEEEVLKARAHRHLRRAKIVKPRRRYRPTPTGEPPGMEMVPEASDTWTSFGEDLLLTDPDMDYDIYFNLICPDCMLG